MKTNKLYILNRFNLISKTFSYSNYSNLISPMSILYDKQINKDILAINKLFSEKSLIKARTRVEIEWLKSVVSYILPNSDLNDIKSNILVNKESIISKLDQIKNNFNNDSALKVKEIEKTTNHDVKAVEYYIKSEIQRENLPDFLYEFTHFCCTSEDINNLSWSLMINEALNTTYLANVCYLVNNMCKLSIDNSDCPMMSRTHGQSATPTTFGKEIANFSYRLNDLSYKIRNIKLKGKINGAVGNFNAHKIIYPNFDWPMHSKVFIENLGLEFNPYTTQIENHDSLCEVLNYISLINTVMIDLTRDLYGYNTLGYLSNTEENRTKLSIAEGNLNLSNKLLKYFTTKLPISRYQRDLSDSTVIRNIGISLGHSILAMSNLNDYLLSVTVKKETMQTELNEHWELLAEPLQTIMRFYGFKDPYEILKEHTRGKKFTKDEYLKLVSSLTTLPKDIQVFLLNLSPSTYLGNSKEMALKIKDYLK